MYIVMIASECAPVAKVGGLADVVFGLSRELEIRGHAVEIILPKYDCMRYDQVWGLQVIDQDLWVPWDGGAIRCTVWFGFVHGRKCFFIEPHSRAGFFERGTYYGFRDDPERFAFFSKAALEFLLKSRQAPGHHPHARLADRAGAGAAVRALRRRRASPISASATRSTTSATRASTGPEILRATGLDRPEYFGAPDRMGDDFDQHSINLMRGAILYANFVTTVSPHHAWEARHTDLGFGLGHALHLHQDKFGGILNGLDYEMWNPETDPHIPQHYSAASRRAARPRTRRRCASACCCATAHADRRLRRPARHPEGPAPDPPRAVLRARARRAVRAARLRLRARHQRGLLAPEAPAERQPRLPPRDRLRRGARAPDLRRRRPARDAEPVRALRADADDRAALRHRAGGARRRRPQGHRVRLGLLRAAAEQRNGFVFEHADHARARVGPRPRARPVAQRARRCSASSCCQGMACDYSWNHPGQHYLDIYEFIRHK